MTVTKAVTHVGRWCYTYTKSTTSQDIILIMIELYRYRNYILTNFLKFFFIPHCLMDFNLTIRHVGHHWTNFKFKLILILY